MYVNQFAVRAPIFLHIENEASKRYPVLQEHQPTKHACGFWIDGIRPSRLWALKFSLALEQCKNRFPDLRRDGVNELGLLASQQTARHRSFLKGAMKVYLVFLLVCDAAY